MTNWVRPAGTARSGDWAVRLDPGDQLEHAGIAVRDLRADEVVRLEPDGTERLLVPLAGELEAEVGAARYAIARRGDVLECAPDVLYVPVDRLASVRAAHGPARLLIASARADVVHDVQLISAADVPVEVRGTPPARREVRDIGGEQTLSAQRLLVCEVITPAGGWSSFPPHKHDRTEPGGEVALEEIYYYELRSAPGGPAEPVGYHRTFASDHRPIDILAEVRSGDTVLVPHGWHGPCIAAPGCGMYYLNVMAGPGERTWRVVFHPDYLSEGR